MKVRLKSLGEMYCEGLPLKFVNRVVYNEKKGGYYTQTDCQKATANLGFVSVSNSGTEYYMVNTWLWAKWACEVEAVEEKSLDQDKPFVACTNPPWTTVTLTNGWSVKEKGDKLYARYKDWEEFEVIAPPRVMSKTEIEVELGHRYTLYQGTPMMTHAEIETELGYKISLDKIPF